MAHIPRLYVDDTLEKDQEIALAEGQGKYLTRVMRLASGAQVRVFNGRDGEWLCRLIVVGRKVSLEPTEQTRPQTEGVDLTLLFAPIKKARTDFIIEKASELGVSRIQPVLTDYTQTKTVRLDRLLATAIEAAEQTERMDIPGFSAALPLTRVLADWPRDIGLIYCDEAGTAQPIPEVLRESTRPVRGVLVGPEGGFSATEREMLRALDFVIPVSLGPRILRAETAVVSALTLWQSELGDWRKRPYLP